MERYKHRVQQQKSACRKLLASLFSLDMIISCQAKARLLFEQAGPLNYKFVRTVSGGAVPASGGDACCGEDIGNDLFSVDGHDVDAITD